MSVFTAQSTGWSALFFAAERGDVDTVDLLIKAGANPRLTDQVSQKETHFPSLPFLSHLPHPSLSHLPLQNGLTAEAVAAASGHGEVYQLLSRLTSDLGHDVRETGATSEKQPLSTTEPDRQEPEVCQPEPDMGEPEVSQPDPNKTATHQQPPLPVASRITQVWSCVV